MVPEIPEIVNGIQFALQNNISLRYNLAFVQKAKKQSESVIFFSFLFFLFFFSLSLFSLEVGICIAVQVCMLQMPILVLFNAFYVRHLQPRVRERFASCFPVWSHTPSLCWTGCRICAVVQRPAPMGQYLQRYTCQLHLHGWQVGLFSG